MMKVVAKHNTKNCIQGVVYECKPTITYIGYTVQYGPGQFEDFTFDEFTNNFERLG